MPFRVVQTNADLDQFQYAPPRNTTPYTGGYYAQPQTPRRQTPQNGAKPSFGVKNTDSRILDSQ